MSMSVKLLLQHHTRKTTKQRIVALLQNANLTRLLQLHALYIKTCFFCHDNFLKSKFLNAVISLSSPHHDADLYYARSMFDSFSLPDTFIWNTMMRAYLNAQKPAESLALYFQMRFHDDLPLDSFSLSLVLQACGRAMQLRCLILWKNQIWFAHKVLLSEYVKIGDIQRPVNCLTECPKRFGFMEHHYSWEWAKRFMKYIETNRIGIDMKAGDISFRHKLHQDVAEGIKPNDVTFMVPSRAASEAWNSLGLSLTPDAIVWRAFLGACRIHKNIELAEELLDFDLLDMRLQHQGTQYLEEHEKQNQLATHSEKLAIAFEKGKVRNRISVSANNPPPEASSGQRYVIDGG
ncbi:pentatricopeptide repeat-containing protein At3g56550-like [Prosopis cineraria]|uniref:pentatricopeptide repeat-containing protein At3g56550-like n=1 Tax=Prosopis cineraria TaxID=364024 RepID=UPI00240EC3B0|nr:pentatricopeptide repeat-containing protein At3g56550-like [Prosopis cineraria]